MLDNYKSLFGNVKIKKENIMTDREDFMEPRWGKVEVKETDPLEEILAFNNDPRHIDIAEPCLVCDILDKVAKLQESINEKDKKIANYEWGKYPEGMGK